jgi:serine/threonine protein kinase
MSTPNFPGMADPLDGTPYRSTNFLGSGAWGDVIEGEHRGLGKRVVVKVVRMEVVANADVQDRFRLEAQTLASLDRHPNVVQVFDCGRTPSGRPYLVMEHLEGRTLQEEMAVRGPFSAAEAVHLADQVLCGLEAVHNAGLVHRDIKPSNLFLCNADADGARALKILDFGIVKIVSRSASKRAPAPLARPTTEGVTIGTPQYLAPEQALGLRVDRRADVYAVGAVLYWMLVGKHPFYGHRDAGALLHAHVNLPPNPPSARAKHPVTPPLDDVILKAMSKRPDDRFASVEEFRAALKSTLAPRSERWPSTAPLDTSAIRAAGPRPPDRRPHGGPVVRQRWASTEPLDTSAIRAAGPRPPDRRPRWASTEPLDTSAIRAAGPVALDRSVCVVHDSDGAATLPCPPSVLRLAVLGEPWQGGGCEERQEHPATSSPMRPTSATHPSRQRRAVVGVLAALAVLLILGGIAALVHVALAHRAAAAVG